jgi:Uma2 family endonuclease
MSVTIVKWTLDDYHCMINVGLLEGRRVELLNGEVIEMSPEGEPHAYLSHEAAKYLGRLLGNRADIRQGKPITISINSSEPEPDLAIVQPLGREYLQHHPYPENIFWLVEFSNTSLSKDIEIKPKAYATAGINEYWVVDLKNQRLRVFRNPIDGKYQIEDTLIQGELSPLCFPDVMVSVPQLLEG